MTLHALPSLLQTPSSRLRVEANANLFDYQKEGIRWMLQAWHDRKNVILADEMGLGKTLQTVGLISELFLKY